MYKNKNSKIRSKKRTIRPSSVYWKVGNLFRKFNENIEHEFEITNYNAALEHDFGLSNRYVQELIVFASLFNEKEIDDKPIEIKNSEDPSDTDIEEVPKEFELPPLPPIQENILNALEKRKACLMSNHGQVAFGLNLKQAFELAEEVENICHQYIIALKLGQPKILSFAEMQKILEKIKNYKKG